MAWVTGYPVTDQEIDLIYETESAKMWEDQNQKIANPIETLTAEKRIDAWSPLYTARFELGLVLNNIVESMEIVKDTPQGDKLAMLHDTLSDFVLDLKKIEREIWRCTAND